MDATDPPFAFDRLAGAYDTFRPGYPPALFEVLESIVPPPARVLEIGCGTGQATVPLAERGYSVVALEPAPRMARLARRKLARWTGSAVVTVRLEDWPAERSAFDLAVAATSFHWLDPDAAFAKVAGALRPAGWAAVFWNRSVRDRAHGPFVTELARLYRQLAPELARSHAIPAADGVPERLDGMERDFETLPAWRHRWRQACSSEAYVALLETFSDHAALEPARRRRLYASIKALIDGRFGGETVKVYETVLYLGRVRPGRERSPSRSARAPRGRPSGGAGA